MKNQTGGGLLQCIENMNDFLREIQSFDFEKLSDKKQSKKDLYCFNSSFSPLTLWRSPALEYSCFYFLLTRLFQVLSSCKIPLVICSCLRQLEIEQIFKIQHCQLPDAKNVFTVVERFLSRLHILMVHIYHVLSCWVSWHFSLEKQMCKNEKGERRLNRVKEKKDSKIQKAS